MPLCTGITKNDDTVLHKRSVNVAKTLPQFVPSPTIPDNPNRLPLELDRLDSRVVLNASREIWI